MATAAELAILIKASTEGVDRAVDDVGKKLGGLGGIAKTAGLAVGAGVAAGGVAVAGIGVAAVKSAADFQRSMGQVETLGADFGKPFKEIEKDVSNLAKTMGLDATDAATALYNAVSAGVPAENALTFLEAAGQAAVAGEADLSAVGSSMSVVMNSWGDAAGSAEEITDKLFATIGAGVTTMPELASNIGNVAGVASAANVSFEETAAALAQITTKGVTTSVASTQLKATMSELMKPGKSLSDALEAVGYASGTAALEAEGLGGTIALLQGYAEETGVGVNTLFGSVEAGNAVLAIGAGDMEAYNSILGKVGDSAGLTEENAETMNKTFSRQVDLLKSQVSGTLREIGMTLLPVVTKAFEAMAPIVTGALEKVGPIIEDITFYLNGLIAGLTGKEDLGAVFGPIGDSAQGLIDKITSIDFGSIFGTIVETIKGVLGQIDFEAVFGSIQSIIGSVVDFLSGINWESLLGTVGDILGNVMSFVGPVFEALADGVSVVLPIIQKLANIFIEKVMPAVSAVTGFLADHKEMVILVGAVIAAIVGGPITAIIGALIAVGVVVGKAKEFFGELAENVKEKFEEIKAAISEKVDAAREKIASVWQNIKDTVGGFLADMFANIKLIWDSILREIKDKLDAILGRVVDGWTNILNTMNEKLDAIISKVREIWDNIKQTINDKLEDAKRIVESALDFIKELFRRYIEMWKTAIETALKIGQWLWDIITKAGDKVKDALQWLVDKVIKPYIQAWKTVITKAFEIAVWLKDAVTEAAGKIRDIGKQIIDGIKEGITKAWENLKEWFSGLFDDLIGIAKRILGIASPSKVMSKIGEQTMLGFKLGLEAGFRDVQDSTVRMIQWLTQAWTGGGTMTGGGAVVSRNAWWVGLFGGPRSNTWNWSRPGGALPGMAGPALGGGAAGGGGPWSQLITAPGGGRGRTAGPSLLDYIRTASFGAIQGNSLAEWMRAQGYDEETIQNYRDLHTMRGQYGWLTPEARALFRRRTILTGGDWTGSGGQAPMSGFGGLWPQPSDAGQRPMEPGAGRDSWAGKQIVIRVNNKIQLGAQTLETIVSEAVAEISRQGTFTVQGA